MATDIEKSLETEGGGFMISLPSGRIAWVGGGLEDPRLGAGFAAPLGSTYYRKDTADEFKKTGALDTEWTLAGLGSGVSTQNADFGSAGNASANSFLNRAGQVSSNVSGIPILLSEARINAIGASNEIVDTYTIEIYEHEGDFINPILKHTVTVTAARGDTFAGLDIPVTQGNQIAVKVLNAVKNIGVTVEMKGLAT